MVNIAFTVIIKRYNHNIKKLLEKLGIIYEKGSIKEKII